MVEDEDTTSFLQAVVNLTTSDPDPSPRIFNCHVTQSCIAMLVNVLADVCVPDGGADSIVAGRHFLPLTPLLGPGVKRANVRGFDDQAAKKLGLPIGTAITKTVTSSGEEIILRAKHAVLNVTSPHSLLSNYEMREAGVINDDVSKNHFRDTDMNKGTQSIHFLNDNKRVKFAVNLVVRVALMTF